MRIRFGWTLDRAPWQSQANIRSDGTTDTNSTGTTVVTGPLGLLGILQTRLGTTRPTIDRPIRIAQYRSLLALADHPWYRRSFANDPWNTAHRWPGLLRTPSTRRLGYGRKTRRDRSAT